MAERDLLPRDVPYPHLLTHPTRAMTLVYTPEAERENLAQGYVVAPIDTRQIWLIFRPAMRLRVYYG